MSVKTAVEDWLVGQGIGAFYRCDSTSMDTFEPFQADFEERVLTGPFKDRDHAMKAHFAKAARVEQPPYIPGTHSTSVAYCIRKPKTLYSPDPMVSVDQVVRPPLTLVYSR